MPRLAADLAVLDIVLLVAAARIEGDGVLFATVRADDRPGRVGGAVAERKFVVELVREVDHGCCTGDGRGRLQRYEYPTRGTYRCVTPARNYLTMYGTSFAKPIRP